MPAGKLQPEEILVGEISGLFPGSFQLTDRYQGLSHSANEVITGFIEEAEVVIKPFKSFVQDRASHEARMLNMVGELGIPTVRPHALCFGRAANYLITHFDPGIRTLDRADLDNADDDTLQTVAEELGETVADVHANGIIHGDLRTKNTFERINEASFGLLDFERAELHDDPESPGYASGCVYDVTTLINSVRRDVGDGQRADEFEWTFRQAYQQAA